MGEATRASSHSSDCSLFSGVFQIEDFRVRTERVDGVYMIDMKRMEEEMLGLDYVSLSFCGP